MKAELLNLKNVPIITAWFLFFSPKAAFADAGLPMITLIMPISAIAILPVIIIESIYIRHVLELSWIKAGKAAAICNLVSTFAGIPITWAILLFIQTISGGSVAWGIKTIWGKIIAITWQAPWLIPYQFQFNWMVPGAGIVLLIPFFFVSWWIEYLVLRKLFKELNSINSKQAVRNMNLITYSLLFFWLLFLLIKAIV